MPEESAALLDQEMQLLELGSDLINLPFNDFILDFPFGTRPGVSRFFTHPTAADRGRLRVRVRRASTVKGDAATQLALAHLGMLKNPENWLLLEGWEENTTNGGLSISPDFSLVPLKKPAYGHFHNYLHAYPNHDCLDGKRLLDLWCNVKECRVKPEIAIGCIYSELLHATLCRYTVLALIYIAEGFGYLVDSPSKGNSMRPSFGL